jgi:two-component system, LuxR family, sensor kinase FixL
LHAVSVKRLGSILQLLGTEETTEVDTYARSTARERRARRKYERYIAKAREHRSLLASVKSLGFWNWERATDVVWASHNARGILGLPAKGALTRDTLLAAIHPVDRAALVQAISRTACETDTVEMELRVVSPERDVTPEYVPRWATAKAAAYRDSKGMLLRLAGYVIDDTPRKRAEAESVEQQRQITHLTRVAMMGELSATLAHELHQPLTAMLCNAQAGELLAAKETANAEELREIFQEIIRDDKHACEIIHHLRSHLMRGELQLESLDLAQVLDEVLVLARGTLAKHNMHLEARIDEGIPAVQGVRVEIQQILLNLIFNACESMSSNAAENRRIEIVAALEQNGGLHQNGCFVRTSVLDCGAGIGEERLERIFEPFFTTKTGGLGLGLSVCRSIISAHKGQLWATNRDASGAAFHFTLPIAATPRGRTAPRSGR